MKVLHVITSLLAGGAEKLMVDLLPRFNAMGIEVEIAVFNAVETDFMRQLQSAGITVHRFAPQGCNVYDPRNISRLRRLARKGQYDIVHTHNTAPQLFAALCPIPASTRLVTTEHNVTNRRRQHKWYGKVDRWMYGKYDKTICISEKARQALATFIDGDAERFEVINNGIDLSRYTSEVRRIEPGQKVRVTMVAGFRQQKDQDTLVKALALLPERFELMLVGDGERRQQIESLIQELSLGSRVTMPGMRSDVPGVLRDSDIVVLSSHYEGLSLSSIEGMASGRPFVASDVDGLSEVVDGHGLLFPHQDHKALANIILALATDEAFYQATVKKCQVRAKDYDIDQTACKYAEIYKQITGQQHV